MKEKVTWKVGLWEWLQPCFGRDSREDFNHTLIHVFI